MLSTATKLSIAKVASRSVRTCRFLTGRGPTGIFRRSGLRWNLDLKQGIDLSIYLLGSFEPKTVRAYKDLVAPGNVVLDIGANIGAHTLPLARLVSPKGRVIAFEPTHYAYRRLRRNLELNPELLPSVQIEQLMLTADNKDQPEPALYSSWPLANTDGRDHGYQGQLMSTDGATSETLDSAVDRLNVQTVDFIKLDVDGHEPAVIAGAAQTLQRCYPTIVIEFAPSLYKDDFSVFDGMITQLTDLGYHFAPETGKGTLPQSAEGLRARIPAGASCNAIATVGR